MEPNRFLLEGSSLPELKARILAEHGAEARIVAAEQVTVGGIRGFFARRHIEVTVEVPARRRRAAHSRSDVQVRLGIAALLDDADAEEARLYTAAEPRMSTVSEGFADLMDELTFATREMPDPVLITPVAPTVASPAAPMGGETTAEEQTPAMAGVSAAPTFTERAADLLSEGTAAPRASGRRAARRQMTRAGADAAVPRALTGAGNLVIVIGWQDAALPVTRELAPANGTAVVLVAGAIDGGLAAEAGLDRVLDRRTALEARARGVELGQTSFVAFGFDKNPATAAIHASLLGLIRPDQVWVVVDAGRKPADTARWVAEVARSLDIDALAVTGYATTGSPETVDDLGIPVGWVDGVPAPAGTVAAMRQSLKLG
ncbi:hypothetical protein [Cryobacterium cryoconiti]|uniref:Uncharacterized protein n=1 Tax=Cryobacterium cryoconiti TaxID=1259239 RepID=A0A4Y8JZJ6_9MICO|nr:hypothetical protein [Cryobacterium cryoconiti]TFD33090.1 hypothetical protein E3T49_02005 [Cryobacterium cryoconiti]